MSNWEERMSYGFGTRVEAPYTDVLAQVRNALGENGFGVITEIDLAKTLHDKIGAEIPAQVILGACSPSHAYRAIQAEPGIGLLLPCNVVVRADGAGTIVEVIDPQMMVTLSDSSAMCAVADEIEAKLRATVEAVNAAF
ncbi:MAG: DUF302 domain-containing protein [Candidatus Nanopelagicales bacterium]